MTQPGKPVRVYRIGELNVGDVSLHVEVLEFGDDRTPVTSLTRCTPGLIASTNLDAAETRRLRALLSAALQRLRDDS